MKSTIGKINADHLDISHRIKKLDLLEAKTYGWDKKRRY